MRYLIAAWLVGLALVGGVALGAYLYQASVPATVDIALALDAGLTASPGRIDFAGLPPGQKSAIRHLTITNAGTATLSTLAVRGVGLPQGLSLLEAHSPMTPVAPGGKWEVYVQLDAAPSLSVGSYSFTVEVRAE